MEHFSFMKTVAAMAKSGWGREFKSAKEAEASMASDPARLAAYTLLEMLARFNTFAEVISGHKEPRWSMQPEKPSNAKPFLGMKVGDILYSGSLSEGITRHVVLGIDSDGFAIVASEWSDGGWVHFPSFACDWHHTTIADVLSEDVEYEIEYHGGRLKIAEECKSAIEAGEDLSRFEIGTE